MKISVKKIVAAMADKGIACCCGRRICEHSIPVVQWWQRKGSDPAGACCGIERQCDGHH